MYPHHEQSIRKVIEYFRSDPEVQAVVLGGSLAHGFESSSSDIDVTVVLSEQDYAARYARGEVHFVNRDVCTYEGGYLDGKYVDREFLRSVAVRGSEPARFAFKNGRVLYSRVEGMEDMIRAAAKYPVGGKADRLRRFYAQFEAWYWFFGEAIKRGDAYLRGTAVSRFVLFAGRLILTHNELLYPYHKWFLRVLEGANDRPADLMECITDLHNRPTSESAARLYETVKDFREWETPPAGWASQFSIDSELNWVDQDPPVDDL